MNEHILHLVWKYRLLNPLACYSTDGEQIQIISPGIHNEQNSGPDFSTAKIKVGDTLWIGNVEIHLKTSDWYNHLHHLDEAYQSVVLHVVYEDDCGDIEGTKKYPIIELKKCVDASVWKRIYQIESSKSKIPCSKWLDQINSMDWTLWQDRLLIERFERKSKEVTLLYKMNKQNWEKVVFQLIAKTIGGTVNKEPFLILSRLAPMEVLLKHKSDILALESILFGVAGMLNENFTDAYPKKLKQEYLFYKQKFDLEEMENHWWKWMRLRPSAFPTIQIAILSSLIHNTNQLENLFGLKDFKSFKQQIQQSTVLSSYWENHYRFDKPTKEKVKNWGGDLIKRLFINGVISFQIAKKDSVGIEGFENELNLLSQINYENNAVIRDWLSFNVPISTAYESQALLQLYNDYCSRKKCLNCNIGLKVLKRAKHDTICEESS